MRLEKYSHDCSRSMYARRSRNVPKMSRELDFTQITPARKPKQCWEEDLVIIQYICRLHRATAAPFWAERDLEAVSTVHVAVVTAVTL